MHNIMIAPEIAQRAKMLRGGKAHIFEEIDPARTAHLVVDMQNGFMEPGAVAEIATAREIVPAINRISRAVRNSGGINIFIQFVVDPEMGGRWSTFLGGIATDVAAEGLTRTFEAGTHGYALYPTLDMTDADYRIDKSRFGAFSPGTSGLKALLDEKGIDTLIITGTATNVCCETTAREAMQHNYRVIFVADATAALTDIEHNAALNSLTTIFADVVESERVLFLLRAY